MFFDKGKPIGKEICEGCKKEIKPGEKMIISTICPSHGRQLSNRLWSPQVYGYLDNAPKYHEKCYINNIAKKRLQTISDICNLMFKTVSYIIFLC